MLSEPKTKPRPRPLGNARGPLVHNSKHTRRNGSNTRSNSTLSSVNAVSSNSPGKQKETLRERRNRERRSKGNSLSSNEVRMQVKRQMSLPTREELYHLYQGYSRKNKPKLRVTLKERRVQERKLRGTSLNAANLLNRRESLPTREDLYNLYRGYSRKNKMNNVSKFISMDLHEEMDDIFFNYDPGSNNEKIRVTIKLLKEGKSLFSEKKLEKYFKSWYSDDKEADKAFKRIKERQSYSEEEVDKFLKIRFSDDKEVDNILKNLKAVEDKYLNKFPEEKLKIKKYIRIKYNDYYRCIEKYTIDDFRPFREVILQATKELRDAIYDREPVSKKNEIIDKYTNDIRYRVLSDDLNIHLPLVRLRFELFYNSLQFGARSNQTVKDVRPKYRLMIARAKNQLRIASESKGVKGKMELTKANKELIALRRSI